MGPPWHYMPLAADADYAAFALFLRLGNTSAWIAPNATLHESLVVPAGGAAASVDDAIVAVPDLEAAYRYLRCAAAAAGGGGAADVFIRCAGWRWGVAGSVGKRKQ